MVRGSNCGSGADVERNAVSICLDFETYYDADYTLKKLTTEEYIRDQRFEALCLGVSENGEKSYYGQEEIEPYLWSLQRSDAAVICHHTHFDGLILTHHFGFIPSLWLDTLSMSRAVHGLNAKHSLEALAKHYHFP